jgi:hypothetical protein
MAGEAGEYALASRLNANLTFERDSIERRGEEPVAVVAAVSNTFTTVIAQPSRFVEAFPTMPISEFV